MKVVIYMAVTADGYIAKDDDDVGFVSKSSWESFDVLSKRAGNIIMGRRTYDVSVKDGTFPYPGRVNIVVTSKRVKNVHGDDVHFVSTPQAALALLKTRRAKAAFVAGGGKLNASFLEAGLADELYLDVAPVILGTGIRLFGEGSIGAKLELVEIGKLSKDEVQLHYTVKR